MKIVILSVLLITLVSAKNLSKKRDIIGEAFNDRIDPGKKAIAYSKTKDTQVKLDSVSLIIYCSLLLLLLWFLISLMLSQDLI